MSPGLGTDVTTAATGVGSAKIGFLLEREADRAQRPSRSGDAGTSPVDAVRRLSQRRVLSRVPRSIANSPACSRENGGRLPRCRDAQGRASPSARSPWRRPSWWACARRATRAGASPAAPLTLAQVSKPIAGAPPQLAALRRRVNELAGGGPQGVRRAAARAARPPGRREHVGLVVRPVPPRAAAVSAPGAASAARASRSSASNVTDDRDDAVELLRRRADALPVVRGPALEHRHRPLPRAGLPDDRVLRRARPAHAATRASSPARRSSPPRSSATRCDERPHARQRAACPRSASTRCPACARSSAVGARLHRPTRPTPRARASAARAAAGAATRPDPPPQDNPDLFAALAARGTPRGHRARPSSRCASLAELAVERGAGAAVEAWRERMRAHDGAAYVHLGVDEGPRPRSRAELYALDFVPADGRPRARALQRARRPDDGRQPARGPRRRRGPPPRADRRDRRRGRAAVPVRLPAPVPAHARPAPPPRALRGRRPDRRRAPARAACACCARASARARR